MTTSDLNEPSMNKRRQRTTEYPSLQMNTRFKFANWILKFRTLPTRTLH